MVVAATYMSAGQVCMALKRLYVHESRYDDSSARSQPRRRATWWATASTRA
jgi:acyl-CoA reductase-like NAD-dependent aldehyde dehydrogenase